MTKRSRLLRTLIRSSLPHTDLANATRSNKYHLRSHLLNQGTKSVKYTRIVRIYNDSETRKFFNLTNLSYIILKQFGETRRSVKHKESWRHKIDAADRAAEEYCDQLVLDDFLSSGY